MMRPAVRLAAWIEAEEGCRLSPYRCSAGRLTIGIGRNLERAGGGITRAEAEYLFANDLLRIADGIAARWPWTAHLDEVRWAVLVGMAFQMGIDGLAAFGPTLALIEAGEHGAAADRLLRTKWAREDTPARAKRAAEMLRSGKWGA